MPAPHALCSKMLAERTASRNALFYSILFYLCFAQFARWHTRLHYLATRQPPHLCSLLSPLDAERCAHFETSC